jgi:hypothetical protein
METGKHIRKPEQTMLEYYKTLFARNQSKWIRKSMLEPKDLGSVFEHEGEEFELIGSVSPKEFIIKSNADDKHYIVLNQFVDQYLLK